MTAPNPTANSPESWLATVWNALHEWQDQQDPEHDAHVAQIDEQWDDITTAMAWITESMGLPSGYDYTSDEPRPQRNSLTTIERIKLACDAGLRVTLASNDNYTVIKDSIGQYLIAYKHGSRDANYIGLHGRPGTEYAEQINMSGDWLVTGRITG